MEKLQVPPSCPFGHVLNDNVTPSAKSPRPGKEDSLLPPGPNRSPESHTDEWFRRPYEFMRECAQSYGDIFTIRFAHLGPQVVVSRPDHLKAVFTGDPNHFHAGKGNAILGTIMGSHSPMLLDGDHHLQRRKVMLRPFQLGQVLGLKDTMDHVTTDYTSHWRDGDIVLMQTTMLDISLRIILRVVFGVHDDLVLHRLLNLIQRFVTLIGTQSVLMHTNRESTQNSKVRELWQKQLRSATEAVDAELYAHIERRRQARGPKWSHADILGMLLDASEEDGQPLSNEVLRDHLMTLFIAGHETSASALSWAMYWLLRTPHSYATLQKELDDGFGHQGPYLAAVCQETLRKNPPISEVSRQLQYPMSLEGYRLPAGIAISPSIYLAHHRPETFPAPDAFSPERFLDRKYTPYEYAPFGGGVRRCIGMNFTLVELQTVLANLLRTFRFESAESIPTRPMRRAILVSPSGGGRTRIWRK